MGGGIKSLLEENGIKVVILTDNPIHGWIKNYEWASRHATGDYIFNCDQDDVWEENKIEEVMKVFDAHSDALYVAHGLSFINGKGEHIGDKNFIKDFDKQQDCLLNEHVELNKNIFFTAFINAPQINALATAISKKLFNFAFPIPKYCPVDQWEPFVALCYGKAYYINSNLASHRYHESNTTGSDSKMGLGKKIKRVVKRLRKSTFCIAPYYGGKAMMEVLEKCNMKDTQAYQEAIIQVNLGEKKKEIAESGRIVGFFKLIHLYRTSMRFRRSGPNDIYYQLWAVLCGRVEK